MSTLYISQAARKYALTERIIAKLKKRHIVWIDSFETERFRNLAIEDAKKAVFLDVHRGSFIKKFPKHPELTGSLRDYFVFHNFNCFMDCQYCFLQGYFEHNVPTIFVNQSELLSELALFTAENKAFMHFGDMGDALLYDRLTGLFEKVQPIARKSINSFFEFRTKTGYIVSPCAESENIIVSWTISPQRYIKLFEKDSVSIEQRLKAARMTQLKGYKIGLHFDPIIAFENWKSEYENVIKQVFRAVNVGMISKISLGVVRFNRKLFEKVRNRFGGQGILKEEFYEGIDGKFRYFRIFREEIYRYLIELLSGYVEKRKIYLCMETPEVVIGSGLSLSNKQDNR